MLQRLIIAYAQVKADNTSENIINKMRQRICFSYQAKEVTKSILQYNKFNEGITQNGYYIYEESVK